MKKMSRKQFIESHGGICRNWTWSWSFINKEEKIIFFGAWDKFTNGNASLIFSESWQISELGQKARGYPQSREHIRLIEEEGYQLKTFPIIYSDSNKNENGIGPAKIKDFTPKLTIKSLKRVGNSWYASDNEISNLLPEEIAPTEEYLEGAAKTVTVNTYERNSEARKECLRHHGYSCAVCSFDFEKFYGSIGEKYIHVHHKISVSEIKKEYKLDPINDLSPVCPNCHAVIHRTRPALTIEQLRTHLAEKNKNT